MRPSHKLYYEGDWENAQDDCMLCEMEKKTHWYIETPRFVVAEKLGGGPFIVFKEHRESLDEDEWRAAENLVEVLFDDFELEIRMNLVPDHWHAHIVTPEDDVDLSDE